MIIEAKSAYDSGCEALDQQEFATAAAAFTRAVGIEPSNPLYLCGAALAKSRIGYFGESETLYRKAIKATKTSFGDDHAHVATVTFGLIDLYWNQGRYLEVEKLCQDLLDSINTAPFTSGRARITHRLAEIYRQQGLFKKAEAVYLKAIEDCEAEFGPFHPKVAEILPNLADLYRLMGRKLDAANAMQRAIAVTGAPTAANKQRGKAA